MNPLLYMSDVPDHNSSHDAALAVGVRAARRGAECIRTHANRQNGVRVKGRNDFVTDADEAAQEAIIDVFQDAMPGVPVLAEEGAVIPKMGAHLAPEDTPEFNGGAFTNTLIWGAADVDDSAGRELHFVEPMVTVDHLRGRATVDRRPVAQPDVYPTPGWYPTSYAVGPADGGGYAVALAAFEERE